MRITQNMMTSQFLYNITNDNQNMASLENELSTGKTLNKPSDNPLAVSQDMSINATISETTGYQTAISAGQTWMNNTSAAMQSMSSSLTQIQDLVEQGLNATNQSSASRNALSTTAAQYVQNIQQLIDSKQGNRYLFGGTATTNAQPPSSYALPSPGTTATTNPQGSKPTGTSPNIIEPNINFLVAPNVTIAGNVTAYSLLQTTFSGATDTLGVTLNNIAQDLASGNSTKLTGDLANLNAGMLNLTNQSADLGAKQQQMTAVSSQMSQYSTLMTNQKGVIEGANMAQVITQFNTDQTVFNAALKMGSQVLLPSLVTYL